MPENPGRSNKVPHSGRPAGRRYAKINDAAEYFAVTPWTIRKLITDGHIHGYRIGTRVLRVDLNELDALVAGETGGVA
jgi:excisionase family DNA binding protein